MLHLNYKSYGHSGHPLIILHGLLGMLDNWQTQSKKYAGAGFKVYAVDQRNHGKSPHSDTFNYEAMATDIRDFMHHHHLPSAHILGHSMGGKTAMQFALMFPDFVDKLVVVDVAPRKYANAHDEILDAMCSLKLGRLSTRHEADVEIAKRIPGFALRQFILKNLTRTDDGKLKWKVNLSIIRKHYYEIAGDLTAESVFSKPTLFVKGAKSKYIAAEDRERIKRLFPRSIIATIADTGHWVHADKPEEFGIAVLKFLLS
ncbi:MAG: alpha/beta fold hydrolase [Bacteroidetes bacterium]|nr:alpha/beta fold hydrolase [Bacteroidota bacterium]MCW5895923.1 alpha/beta fold hydrolase [Bacteroidota bacterium]